MSSLLSLLCIFNPLIIKTLSYTSTTFFWNRLLATWGCDLTMPYRQGKWHLSAWIYGWIASGNCGISDVRPQTSRLVCTNTEERLAVHACAIEHHEHPRRHERLPSPYCRVHTPLHAAECRVMSLRWSDLNRIRLFRPSACRCMTEWPCNEWSLRRHHSVLHRVYFHGS